MIYHTLHIHTFFVIFNFLSYIPLAFSSHLLFHSLLSSLPSFDFLAYYLIVQTCPFFSILYIVLPSFHTNIFHLIQNSDLTVLVKLPTINQC